MPELTALQADVLDALRAAGGKAMVHDLIRDGFLPGNAKGLVTSWYPSVESAGVSKVWQLKSQWEEEQEA